MQVQLGVWQALKGLALVACVAALAGCASSPDAALALNPDPPSKMYADADALMSKGKFEDAAKKFEDVDREHPYSPEARRAIVMAAYAYYKAGKLPEAIASAERYTTMHPGTKEAPLAHHIIASSYFEQIQSAEKRSGCHAQGAGRAQDAQDALSRQHLRAAGRQPHPAVRGHARGPGDGGRPLLREAQGLRGGDQPLQDRRLRLPDDRPRGGSALPADRRLPVARHRLGGAERGCGAGAQLPQLALVQGLLRAAAVAGFDAVARCQLVGRQGLEGPPTSQPPAAPPAAAKPAVPPADSWEPTTPSGPPPPSTLGGPST